MLTPPAVAIHTVYAEMKIVQPQVAYQATAAPSNLLLSLIQCCSSDGFSKTTNKFVQMDYPVDGGQVVFLSSVFSGGSSWVHATVWFDDLSNPSHVSRVTLLKDVANVDDFTVPGIADVLKEYEQEIAIGLQALPDLTRQDFFTERKVDVQKMGSFVLTGRQAFEACMSVVEGALNALQTIVTHQYYWLTAVDLLTVTSEISASRLFDLFAVWTTSGAKPLINDMGPIGRSYIENSTEEIANDLKPLGTDLVDLAEQEVFARKLRQDSARVWISETHQKRINDKV